MTETHREDSTPDGAPVPGDPVVAGPPPPPPPPPPGPGGGQQLDRANRVRLALLIAAFALFGIWAGWPALVMVAGLVVMIFLHELGHYLTAKWAGMKVTEFFLGAGPKLWSFRRGETEYGVKLVPVLAYVRIIGMNNLDEVDPADEPRTFRQQSFPKRLLVVSAGSLMHALQAFVLLVVLLGVVGVPGGSVVDMVDMPDRGEAWQVNEVVEDSAAERAGLREGDRIVALDGRPASSYDDLAAAISEHEVGDRIVLDVVRDGERLTLDAELGPRPEDEEGGAAGSPFLGVASSPWWDDQPIGLPAAIARAPGEMAGFSVETVKLMVDAFSPDRLRQLADQVRQEDAPAQGGEGRRVEDGGGSGDGRLISIIGFVQVGSQEVDERLLNMLLLFFQINVFVGIFNMLPLLPLDGGHAVVAIYERLRSRPGRPYHADFAKLLPLTYAVVMVLVIIGATTIYLDIVNPIV
ncbi:MAG: site-2 protease family protein [Thermoanaerobacterales bacterium]|nr:RIP metalloprotease [Thermoanaerobacterales bacterium]